MPANILTLWSKQFEEIQQEHIMNYSSVKSYQQFRKVLVYMKKKYCKPMWLETCIL